MFITNICIVYKARNEIETRNSINTLELRNTFSNVLNYNKDNLKINSGPLLMIYEQLMLVRTTHEHFLIHLCRYCTALLLLAVMAFAQFIILINTY